MIPNRRLSLSLSGISEIIEEVCGIGGILGEQIVLDTNVIEEDFSKVEEQFTMARVYANKTKTMVESLTQEQRKQTGIYIVANCVLHSLSLSLMLLCIWLILTRYFRVF